MKSRSRVENSWFCAGYVYLDNGTRGQKSEAETTQGEPTGGGRDAWILEVNWARRSHEGRLGAAACKSRRDPRVLP